MPVDDALTLVGRSFETYTQTAREKPAAAAPPPERGAAPPPPARAPPPFLPAGPDISYLLNLLADNRQLTIEEIDKVIGYLRERRDKLYETDGRRPPESGNYLVPLLCSYDWKENFTKILFVVVIRFCIIFSDITFLRFRIWRHEEGGRQLATTAAGASG
jgi:hypothetical protein